MGDVFVDDVKVVYYDPHRKFGFAHRQGSYGKIFFHLDRQRRVKLTGKHGDPTFTREPVAQPPVVGQTYRMEYTPSHQKGKAPFRALLWGEEPDWKDRLAYRGLGDYKGGDIILDIHGRDYYRGTLLDGSATRDELTLHIRKDGGSRDRYRYNPRTVEDVTRVVPLQDATYERADAFEGGTHIVAKTPETIIRLTLLYPPPEDDGGDYGGDYGYYEDGW